MGRIINEKNVKIIIDGLELLKKHLEIFTPIYKRDTVTSQNTSYNISDIQLLIDTLLKDNSTDIE